VIRRRLRGRSNKEAWLPPRDGILHLQLLWEKAPPANGRTMKNGAVPGFPNGELAKHAPPAPGTSEAVEAPLDPIQGFLADS
jgi:hypothetical protein